MQRWLPSGPLAKLDSGSTLIFCHRSDALRAGDGGFQFFKQCVCILCSNRNHEAAGGLRIIKHILLGQFRITGIHCMLGKATVMRWFSPQ